MKQCILLICVLTLKLQATVVPYDFPKDFPLSERYEVNIDHHSIIPLQTKRGAILNFGMSAPVRVQVKLDKVPEEVVIRPLQRGIKAKVEGRMFSFELTEPMNLSVEVDGDLENPLLVFANPLSLFSSRTGFRYTSRRTPYFV